MLDVLRARKGGILSWIFLGAIIAVFILYFGPGAKFEPGGAGCGGAPSTSAAVVDGKPVPAILLRIALSNSEERLRERLGERYAEQLPLVAESFLNELVEEAVVAREAERRGIRISLDELKKEQWNQPQFQEDGKFSLEWYRDIVTRRYGSEATYLDLERQRLATERLQAAFAAGVHVPESEVKDTWKRDSDRVDLVYVVFPTADARAEVKLTDAEVQAFAAKQPARIQKFYDENAARYDQPKKVRARHVLARVDGADGTAARQKIDEAIARLQKGEDFAKIASELSDDETTKATGGDLGVIAAGQVDDAFAKAALELEAGQLSGPVQTPSGWHVIRVDEVFPGKKIPLADVRADIARELLTADRAAAVVNAKAEAALAAARSGKSLTALFPQPRPAIEKTEKTPAVPEVKAALTLGGKPVVAVETRPFPASLEEVYGMPGSGKLLQDAGAAQSGTVLPRVYETANGPAVAVVRTRTRPDENLYPVQRRAVELGLQSEKGRQLEYAWRAELRKRADIELNRRLIEEFGGRAPAQPQ